jgi:hypothetical protein
MHAATDLVAMDASIARALGVEGARLVSEVTSLYDTDDLEVEGFVYWAEGVRYFCGEYDPDCTDPYVASVALLPDGRVTVWILGTAMERVTYRQAIRSLGERTLPCRMYLA